MIDMEKIISIGDKVDLRLISQGSMHDEEVPVYPSRVLDMKENNVLQLAMPFVEGHVVPLAVNDKYEICVYAKNGLYTCNGIVVERYKTDNMFFFDAAVFTTLSKVQRREYYRYAYRTNIDFRIVPETVALDGQEETLKQQEEAKWYNGIIMDLSGGGVRMISALEPVEDMYLELRFEIRTADGEEVIKLFGHPIRCLPVEGNPRLKDYRVKFVKLDQAVQEKIIHFIFEEERRSLSRGRK